MPTIMYDLVEQEKSTLFAKVNHTNNTKVRRIKSVVINKVVKEKSEMNATQNLLNC